MRGLNQIDARELKENALRYAKVGGACPSMQDKLERFLDSDLIKSLLGDTGEAISLDHILDAYKPKMHKLYAAYLSGVTAEFALNVRKSPISLQRMQQEDAELLEALINHIQKLTEAKLITDRRRAALKAYYAFETSEEMEARSSNNPSAEVTWCDSSDGQLRCVARGPIDSASAMEAGCTQAVQEAVISAQVRQLERQHGIGLSREERLGNSLGHLACLCSQLQNVPNLPKMALFAGRRSTDRVYLLLQNAFCTQHLANYIGTSAIYAVERIDEALQASGVTSSDKRRASIGVLVGTHAHEVMSVMAQLMSCWDQKVDAAGDGPVAVSALLAHLLFLAVNGGLESATALADTFGTKAFLSAALVTRIPEEFIEDIQANKASVSVPEGAMVFDLIRVWRVDSGDYADIAHAIMDAWSHRNTQLPEHGQLPKPQLMNSNLSSVEDILEASRLPCRIRPNLCAFGGLADGFLPFQVEGKDPVELDLASVVMKAVQARALGVQACMPCCGKLGDDANHSKAQVDFRLPAADQKAAKDWMSQMFAQRSIDTESASRVLAQMYHEVTRKRIFCS